MPQKVFTLKEANRRLPLVGKIVSDILEKGKHLRVLIERSSGNDLPLQCVTLQEEIDELMGELEDLGCFYKDWNFEIGLVDFPAVIAGENVLLCWKSDEDAIRFYHRFQDGFAGRQGIPESLLISS